jgi:hypothetical protein
MAVQIQIVIIYSPQETATRDALAAALRQAGADVWYEEVSRAKDQALAAFRREVRRRAVVLALLTREALAVERIQRQMALIHEFYQREPQRLLLAFSSEQITAIDINNRLFVRDYRQVEVVSLRPADVTEQALRLLTLTTAAAASVANTLDDVVRRRCASSSAPYSSRPPASSPGFAWAMPMAASSAGKRRSRRTNVLWR